MTTKKELQQICKKREVPGWYKMNKTELERAIESQPTTLKTSEIAKYKNQLELMKKKKKQGYYIRDEEIKEIENRIKKLQKPSPVKKSKRKLKIYMFSASIRSEGIGDVNFIIATSSKKNAAERIDKAGYGRWGSSWIMTRINTFDAESFSHIRPYKEYHKDFKPMDTPDVLFMYETNKMTDHGVSYRKNPKFIKKWKSE